MSTLVRFNTRYEVQHGKAVTGIHATGGLSQDLLIQHVLDSPELFLKIPVAYWEPVDKRKLKSPLAEEEVYHYTAALGIANRS